MHRLSIQTINTRSSEDMTETATDPSPLPQWSESKNREGKTKFILDMVAQTWNPSTGEAGVRGSWVQEQPRQQSKALPHSLSKDRDSKLSFLIPLSKNHPKAPKKTYLHSIFADTALVNSWHSSRDLKYRTITNTDKSLLKETQNKWSFQQQREGKHRQRGTASSLRDTLHQNPSVPLPPVSPLTDRWGPGCFSSCYFAVHLNLKFCNLVDIQRYNPSKYSFLQLSRDLLNKILENGVESLIQYSSLTKSLKCQQMLTCLAFYPSDLFWWVNGYSNCIIQNTVIKKILW